MFDSAVSFLHPEWPVGFDLDVPMATKARIAFLDRAAADKALVGGYHLPFPGFGQVVRDGSAYRWLPADWQWRMVSDDSGSNVSASGTIPRCPRG
jgi:hypothetical protein